MKEEIKRFLNNETYILAYRSNYDSAREVNQMLIDYVKDLQSQLKSKEEVIKEAREYVNTKLTEFNLRYGLDNEFRQEYDDLLEILSKGENKEIEFDVLRALNEDLDDDVEMSNM